MTLTRRSALALAVAFVLTANGCGTNAEPGAPSNPTNGSEAQSRVRTAGFLAVDGVYNSELMAPYDILHHSIFRDESDYIEPFVVSPGGRRVTTFEGLEIGAHHALDSAPRIDILVIPSAVGSMSSDLEDERLITWIRKRAEEAEFVITLCDGAFPLAATGLLNDRDVTTFPGDRDALAAMFPRLRVHDDANFVVDGKYITSVGGALSYEPALFLLETVYSKNHAVETGVGLVLDWNLDAVPHLIADAPVVEQQPGTSE